MSQQAQQASESAEANRPGHDLRVPGFEQILQRAMPSNSREQQLLQMSTSFVEEFGPERIRDEDMPAFQRGHRAGLELLRSGPEAAAVSAGISVNDMQRIMELPVPEELKVSLTAAIESPQFVEQMRPAFADNPEMLALLDQPETRAMMHQLARVMMPQLMTGSLADSVRSLAQLMSVATSAAAPAAAAANVPNRDSGSPSSDAAGGDDCYD